MIFRVPQNCDGSFSAELFRYKNIAYFEKPIAEPSYTAGRRDLHLKFFSINKQGTNWFKKKR